MQSLPGAARKISATPPGRMNMFFPLSRFRRRVLKSESLEVGGPRRHPPHQVPEERDLLHDVGSSTDAVEGVEVLIAVGGPHHGLDGDNAVRRHSYAVLSMLDVVLVRLPALDQVVLEVEERVPELEHAAEGSPLARRPNQREDRRTSDDGSRRCVAGHEQNGGNRQRGGSNVEYSAEEAHCEPPKDLKVQRHSDWLAVFPIEPQLRHPPTGRSSPERADSLRKLSSVRGRWLPHHVIQGH